MINPDDIRMKLERMRAECGIALQKQRDYHNCSNNGTKDSVYEATLEDVRNRADPVFQATYRDICHHQ